MTRQHHTSRLRRDEREGGVDAHAMTRCFPRTRCLSSSAFILTMERAAEVSDAKRT